MPDHRGRSASIVRWLLRPRIIVPVFVSAAIIGALVAFADLGKLANLLTGLRPIYVVGAAVLILGYNAVQSVQCLYLLDHLGIVAPRRDALLAFAGGNLTKYLPGGSYFQNYLLNETSGADPLYAALADQVVRFRDGLKRIAGPHTLATTTGLTAVLVLFEGLALYMIARSLRIDGLSVTAALAAYYFSIGVALIVPIFTNLGTLEAGGVAALITLGVSREGAVAVMVPDRALIIVVAIVLAVIIGLAFRDLVGRAVRAA